MMWGLFAVFAVALVGTVVVGLLRAPRAITDEAAEIERLRSENGSLRHNCAVAKIGHDQLNGFTRMLVGVGAPTSMPIDAQVEWACKEIERLRTKLAEAEKVIAPFAKVLTDRDLDQRLSIGEVVTVGHLRAAAEWMEKNR